MSNTDIEKLLMEYEEEECNFRDMNWVAKTAWRTVRTMPDSQSRCLLYAFVREFEEASGTTISDNEEAMTTISFVYDNNPYLYSEYDYWCTDRVYNFLIQKIGIDNLDKIEELEVTLSDGTELDTSRII